MEQKKYLVTKLIILCGVFVVAIGLVGGFLVWQASQYNHSYNNYSAGSEIQEFENITALDINTVDRDVQITGRTDGGNMIKVSVLNKEKDQTGIRGENQTIYVDSGKKAFAIFGVDRRPAVQIQVPADYYLTGKIKTVSGDINISAEMDDFEIKTTSGDINMISGGKNITAKTVSGDIEISAGNRSEKYSLKSTSGDIGIRLLDGIDYGIDYKTVGGDVEVREMDLARSGVFGDAAAKFQILVDSVSGDLEIM